MYQKGDLVRVFGNFKNASSVAADPGSVYFRMVVGSADVQYTWPTTNAIGQTGTGSFYVDVTVESPGQHFYYWRGYGTVQAGVYGAFDVATPPAPF